MSLSISWFFACFLSYSETNHTKPTQIVLIHIVQTFSPGVVWIFGLISGKWTLFLGSFQKKTLFWSFGGQKLMTHNFWDHHPNLHKFWQSFCLLMKKIWGGAKKDFGPSSFQLLVTITIILLTWGLSSMQNPQVLFDSPSKESFQTKSGQNWLN